MYRGIITPLITPIGDDQTVCKESVEKLVASLYDDCAGFMPGLSSGEGWKLSDDQWRDMVSFTLEYAAEKPVFAGVMRPNTSEVIARARRAVELKVDGIVVTSPFGEDIGQEAVLRHYRDIADAVPLPIFIYNESAVSKNVTPHETLLQIARMPEVIGIKESSGSIDTIHALMNSDIDVFQGWENLSYQSIGCNGYVMALANVEPGMCREMFENPTQEQQDELIGFCEKNGLFEHDWYAKLKNMLKARGIIGHDHTISLR